MMLKAYAFFDMKIGIYSSPFFVLHEGQAIRTAQELSSDLQTTIGRHPADYSLHLVGEFNDNTGVLSGVGPAVVVTCASLVAKATPLFKMDQEEI